MPSKQSADTYRNEQACEISRVPPVASNERMQQSGGRLQCRGANLRNRSPDCRGARPDLQLIRNSVRPLGGASNLRIAELMRTLVLSGLLFVFTACASRGPHELSSLTPKVSEQAVQATPTIDLGVIATAIARNVSVREGDLVWISGAAGNVEFMERLAVAVAAEGGQPLVSVFSDATLRAWYREVPERFDAQRDEWRWQIHEKADVVIFLPQFDPATFAEIAPERLRAYGTANRGADALLHERGVRIVWIGNGSIFPSEWAARMFGIEHSELEHLYWTGMATDATHLTAVAERFTNVLQRKSTIRVQHSNGTDITFRGAGQRIVVSDGTLRPGRPEPAAAPVPNETWLPGGEVTLGVDPESAEGRLVLERFFLDGRAHGRVALTFSGGRLLTMESESDLSRLRELSGSALPMSERLTGMKFGINPDITDERVRPLMGAGTISLTMGSNLVLGGDLDLPYGPIWLTLSGSTIHVDGVLVVEDGVLKL
jgi:leucyl aminopeptidase (aminopeptidase T)